jgi:transcriptional regulator with XRE-family HTH domain
MPKLNPDRLLAGEATVARRVERERRLRGLSYEGLAAAMTNVGCPIQGSAIFRIEKGDPPRRVTVNELMALAIVFETSIEDLLTPVEILDERQLKDLLERVLTAWEDMVEAGTRLHALADQVQALTEGKPEFNEYVSEVLGQFPGLLGAFSEEAVQDDAVTRREFGISTDARIQSAVRPGADVQTYRASGPDDGDPKVQEHVEHGQH